MQRKLAIALALVGTTGCCFASTEGSGSPPQAPLPLPPPEPVDPSLDALWACAEADVVDEACRAPVATLPASEIHVALTYRTERLEAFHTPGEIIAYVGLVEPQEIARTSTGDTSDVAPAGPHEVVTWTEHIRLRCPDTGWPVGVSVDFDLRDGQGRRAASTSLTFTGPPVVPPPLHALRVVNTCSDTTVAGMPDDPYCPGSEATFRRGVGRLHVSYTSDDPAPWAREHGFVLERRTRRGDWEIESDDGMVSPNATPLPPDEIETAHESFALDQRAFARGSHWRARFVAGGETLAERELDIE